MSTLKQDDVDIMIANRTAVAASRFQYDYLNDDISDMEMGEVFDYTQTQKLPEELRRVIKENQEGRGKVLVLMNPPYAEAGNADNASKAAGETWTKDKVADTKVAKRIMGTGWGKATNELFSQFIARISVELPNAVVATFSTLKYVNSTNFEKFRQQWNAEYLGGFIVHSKTFDGLDGNFPIGFLVWQTRNGKDAPRTPITEITCEALDKEAQSIGEKMFYNLPASTYLNVWIDRPKANNVTVVPVKNAVTVATAKFTLTTSKWSDGAIGYLFVKSNDFQNASQQTAIFSSMYGDGHGIYVTPSNLLQCAVVFTVRRIVPHTWQNDRDQFLQPAVPLPDEFMTDCLLWMLFSGSNLTAGADGLVWKSPTSDKDTWSLTNHFFPYTEDEVGVPSAIPSPFMNGFLAKLTLSAEARAVLDAGREVYKAYYKYTDPRQVRDQLRLGRADAGWYQIRNALKARTMNGDVPTEAVGAGEMERLDAAYKTLTEKIKPKVLEYGFLK